MFAVETHAFSKKKLSFFFSKINSQCHRDPSVWQARFYYGDNQIGIEIVKTMHWIYTSVADSHWRQQVGILKLVWPWKKNDSGFQTTMKKELRILDHNEKKNAEL